MNKFKWEKEISYPCNLSNLKNNKVDNEIKELIFALNNKYKISEDLTELKSYDLTKRIVTNGTNFWLITNKYKRYLDITNKSYNDKNILLLSNDIIDKFIKYENKSNSTIKHGSNLEKYNMNYNICYEDAFCLFNIYNNFNYPIIHIFSENISFFCQNEKNIDTIPIFKTNHISNIYKNLNYDCSDYILIQVENIDEYNKYYSLFKENNNVTYISSFNKKIEHNNIIIVDKDIKQILNLIF